MDVVCTGLFPIQLPIEHYGQICRVFKRKLPMKIVSEDTCEVLVMWSEVNTAKRWIEQNIDE